MDGSILSVSVCFLLLLGGVASALYMLAAIGDDRDKRINELVGRV